MASIYQSRRPRASPLWQVVHTSWDDFLARYERHHRPAMGPLRPESVASVRAYYRCGDFTTGFTRYQCADCGHERLLAFTCKARHICPACHQCRTRQTAEWISTHVFQTATDCLRHHFRTRLNLPIGRLAAAAALHTLTAEGHFGEEGRFHCMPPEDLTSLTYLFRARFLHALHSAELISQTKLADLLSWKNSGFHVQAQLDPHPSKAIS
jgi:hypothetical protein